jgi:hypothetical protein
MTLGMFGFSFIEPIELRLGLALDENFNRIT